MYPLADLSQARVARRPMLSRGEETQLKLQLNSTETILLRHGILYLMQKVFLLWYLYTNDTNDTNFMPNRHIGYKANIFFERINTVK